MKSEGKTFIQCCSCGHITNIDGKRDLVEEMYIKDWKCPRCEHKIGLNLGSDKDDLYELYNVSYDPRYYQY